MTIQTRLISNNIAFFIGSRYRTCCFAKKSLKKSKSKGPPESYGGDLSDEKFVQNDNLDTSLIPPAQNANPIASRNTVLQACVLTCGFITTLGTVIRQVLVVL